MPAANVAMNGEPATPLPWPASRLPERSASPRFRSGLARALMVIRAKPPKGTGLAGTTATLDVRRIVLGRGDPDRAVVRSPERAVAARQDDIVPVIPQVRGTTRVEGLAEREDDGRDPGRADDELFPGHHRRHRVNRARLGRPGSRSIRA